VTIIHDDKYVVFKRDEFEQWLGTVASPTHPTDPDEYERAASALVVDDAVVIRRQDIFAAPMLECYAASISVAADVIQQRGDEVGTKGLRKIADYFQRQADEARDTTSKVPD
jgi:hypothetical protein